MKKTLLLICPMVISITQLTTAQVCTPNPLYADSTFDIWPDTVTDFSIATVGMPYNETLNFKFPIDANEVEPTVPVGTAQLDSIVITDIKGLPSGINYTCENSNCMWLGGEQGCVLLSGTPDSTGTYDINISIIAYGFYVMYLSLPQSYLGYSMEVQSATSVEVVSISQFNVLQNTPNPFIGRTEIIFTSQMEKKVEFKVFNIIGKEVYSELVAANVGQNKITFRYNHLPSGIYMYMLSDGENTITKKMIIDNK